MINLKKVEKMAELSFRNGIRLHFDSITLFNSKSYQSAYFFSVLAMEEIGKSFLLEDFYFSSSQGRMEDEWEKKWMNGLCSHKAKQNSFSYVFYGPNLLSISKISEMLCDGSMEISKQNAIYVGFRNKNNLKSKINNPCKFSKNKTEKQIAELNRLVIDLIIGIRERARGVDIDGIRRFLNKKLEKELRLKWPQNPKTYNHKKRTSKKIELLLKDREGLLK